MLLVCYYTLVEQEVRGKLSIIIDISVTSVFETVSLLLHAPVKEKFVSASFFLSKQIARSLYRFEKSPPTLYYYIYIFLSKK